MKILVCTPRYYPEQFKITQICEHLAKDNEVDVICNIPDYHKGKYYKGYSIFKNRKQVINNVNIYRLFTLPRGKNLIGLAFSYLSLYFSGLFKALFIKKKYDIVLNYQLSPIYIALIGNKIAKKQHIPSITYILDFWPDSLIAGKPNINSKKVLYKIVKKQSKKAYLSSSYIFVTSDGFIRPLVELGYDKSKVFFIPNFGEEIFEKKIIDKNFKIDISNIDNKFKILFAGNIGKAQSFNLALNLAKIAKESAIKNFVFLVVGSGSYLQKLKDCVSHDCLYDYFAFYNEQPIDVMTNFYNLADAFYFSLKDVDIVKETIPGKVSSYIAFSKPIVTDDYWSESKIFKEYNGGVFLKNNNSDLNVLLSLIKNYRKILSNINKDFYFKTFSKKVVLKKIDNCINEVLKYEKYEKF